MGYFTSNILLGLGFAVVVFGLFWLYSRSARFPGFEAAAETSREQMSQTPGYRQATVWALAVTLLVYLVTIIISQRYILPFQPGGFALIVGILTGVLVLYIQRRKSRK